MSAAESAHAEQAHPAVVINAPVLPPRVRHETIFGIFEALPAGHTALLINDHDPKPLIYQLEAEYPGTFAIEYVERGPTQFAIHVTRKE
jgi:uncharacterized protein (DUF2249 family)